MKTDYITAGELEQVRRLHEAAERVKQLEAERRVLHFGIVLLIALAIAGWVWNEAALCDEPLTGPTAGRRLVATSGHP